ncbi:MAG: hypothetical protein M1831_001590 [Alyxoria varia]|nr:MAG: hypothetical protein M1831_001590 [Alyxoria varia]
MRSTFQTALAVVQVALLSVSTVEAGWRYRLSWIFGNDYGNSAYYLLGRGDGGKHPYPDENWLKQHAYITKAVTTVQVPLLPINKDQPFAIFPGLQNDWSDLVQSVIAYLPVSNSTGLGPCGPTKGWCAFANFYTEATNPPHQYSAKGTTVNTGDTIVIEYTYNQQSGEYQQRMLKDDLEISVMSNKPPAGPIHQWSPKTECIGKEATNSPPHIYRQTHIELAEPFPQFPDTALSVNTTVSDPITKDGGKTWDIEVINVQGIECKASPSKGDTLRYILDATSQGSTQVAGKMKRSILPRSHKRRSHMPYRARPNA